MKLNNANKLLNRSYPTINLDCVAMENLLLTVKTVDDGPWTIDHGVMEGV